MQKFDNNGNWLQSIGGTSSADTCRTAPVSSPACTSGSANGQFATNTGCGGVKGVTVDQAGNIWANDTSGSQIYKYTSTGTYLAKSGSGFISCNRTAEFDPAGNIWIADNGATRVRKCASATNITNGTCSTFGTSGAGAYQFSNFTGLAVTPAR